MKLIALTTLACLLGTFSILAQDLSYYTGMWSTKYYQDNQEITAKEFEGLLETNSSSHDLWKTHKTQSIIGNSLGLAQLGSFIWLVSDVSNNRDAGASTIATLGFGGLAIWILSKAINNKREAVLTYNRELHQKTSFKITPSKNGLGIALTF